MSKGQVTVKALAMRVLRPAPYVKDRMRDLAVSLDRTGGMAGEAERANEALLAVLVLVYKQLDDGAYPNVSPVTNRIRVALPWGSVGWRKWKMPYWSARVLCAIMLRHSREDPRLPPFVWEGAARYWWLNLDEYAGLGTALRWAARHEVTVTEWRRTVDMLHTRRVRTVDKL